MTQEPPQSWPPPDDVHPWSVPAVDPLSGEPVPGGVPGPSDAQAWPQPGYAHPQSYTQPPTYVQPYPQPYPQQYAGPYAQPYAGPYAPTAPTNGFAIAALVLGVVWLFWLGSILAVVFGHLARQQIRRTGERGDQLAVAGLILGWIGVGILGLAVFGAIVDPS